jgi:large subunit ribosomal protein L24
MKPLVFKKSRRQARTQATPFRHRIAITKGDTVQVMSGEEKGKRGKVLRVHPKSGRITIEGVNIVKRHLRATQTAEGGIIERPAPIHHSKAMLIDPKSGVPTRVRRRKDTDGTVERIAMKSGEPIPRSR